MYWQDTQYVKFCWRYKTSYINDRLSLFNRWKYPKTEYNQGAFHNLQSRLKCHHIKIFILIKYSIYEGKIQHFRNYIGQLCAKLTKKRYKVKKHSITCSHFWHIDISVFLYWLHTQLVEVWRHKIQIWMVKIMYENTQKNAIKSKNLP